MCIRFSSGFWCMLCYGFCGMIWWSIYHNLPRTIWLPYPFWWVFVMPSHNQTSRIMAESNLNFQGSGTGFGA